MQATMQALPTIQLNFLKSPEFWKYAVYAILVLLMCLYAGTSFWFYQKNGMYTEDPKNIATLLSVRRNDLSVALDRLPPVEASVIANLTSSSPWSSIAPNQTALVNWRPLTVRLCGYLGGANGIKNGVFDMNYGITNALKLGARAFFFDIDYLDVAPCAPVLLYRDQQGYKRSLMSGFVKDGMSALANSAFVNNNDPVIIIVYLRRVPSGTIQKTTFFTNLANSLMPLDLHFLKRTDAGNAYGRQSESSIFTTPISSFSQKFIVMINYDTSVIPDTITGQSNLDYWNNARIYQDTTGTGSSIGPITPSATTPQAYAQVADASQILSMSAADQTSFAEKNRSVFTLAIREPEYNYSSSDLETLLNKLGVQCVPIDVLANAANPNHVAALAECAAYTTKNNPLPLASLSTDNSSSKKDPLSYWYYAGYSVKNVATAEGYADYSTKDASEKSKIPFYTIPSPAIPQKPSPATNANGGLLSIGK